MGNSGLKHLENDMAKKAKKIEEDRALREIERALKATRKDVKIRVNTFIDLAIYDALNAKAESSGEKYQTLHNKYLRAEVFKEISKADIKAIKIDTNVIEFFFFQGNSSHSYSFFINNVRVG
jgi:uncharacterized protein (DUF4415 family)